MVMPSQQTKDHGRLNGIPARRQPSRGTHDPGIILRTPRRQHQRRRNRYRHTHEQHQRHPRQQRAPLLAAFVVGGRPRPNAGYHHRDRRLKSNHAAFCCRHQRFRPTAVHVAATADPAGDDLLSPSEIMEFIKRVDFFGLPPGGIPAGECGLPRALPVEVRDGCNMFCLGLIGESRIIDLWTIIK